MKREMVSVLILALLNLWMPYAGAEISQELDPMVSPDAQATVTGESAMNNMDASQMSNVVGTAEATTADKKVEEKK